MKAVVLAGGYASRLWPITRHRPKMLLPLGARTVIDRIYGELEAVDRVDEVIVSTNERFAADFEAHLDDRPYRKPRLSIEPTFTHAEKLGVVGALGRLIEREGLDDAVLVIAGDNLFSFEIDDLLDDFERVEAPVLAAYDVGSPSRAGAYGVMALEGDRVVGFEEKPETPASSLVSVGCYVFPREAMSQIPMYLEEGNTPDEPGWFLQWLHERVPTYAYTFEGEWFDVGSLETYLAAVAWVLGDEALIADTARLDGASIGPNVHVMAEATLVDVDIEKAVVFQGVHIGSAMVRGSVVDEGAALSGIDLEGAMVGAYTSILGAGEASPFAR